MDGAKTTTKQDEKHLSFGIWCDFYSRADGKWPDMSVIGNGGQQIGHYGMDQ